MKKAIRIFILFTLLIYFCVFNSSSKNNTLIKVEKKKIALIVKMNYGYYWENVKKGAESAAKEFNASIEYNAPEGEEDIEGQIKLVNNAIDENVDAIILAASDYRALAEVTEKAFDKGIPVIIIDSEVDTKKISSYIATDNLEAGKKAANMVVQVVGNDSNIAIMSFVKGTRNAELREEGLINVLSKYPKVKIIDTEYCLSDGNLAFDLTKKIMEEYPQVDAIVALNSIASEGVAQAIEEMKLGSKVKIIAFDNTLQEIDFLDKGIIQATIIQNPFSMGYLGVKNAVDVIEKRKVQKLIYTDAKVIDKNNMYFPENEKLLFPFTN